MIVERRRNVRVPLDAPCTLQLASGETIHGTTREISLDGVFVQCMLNPDSRQRTPVLGEIGVFVLRYRQATSEEALRLRAQLVHLLPNGIGLSIQFAELNRAEQRVLARIVAFGSTALPQD